MYISIIHPSSSGPHSKCIHFPPRDGGVARQRGSLLSSFSNKVFLSFSIFFFYFPPREREKNVGGLLSYCTLNSIQSNWFNASHLLSQGLLFNASKNVSCFVLDSTNLGAERKESSPGLFTTFYLENIFYFTNMNVPLLLNIGYCFSVCKLMSYATFMSLTKNQLKYI